MRWRARGFLGSGSVRWQMGDLTAAREALAALLNGPADDPTGIRAVTVIPKNYTPPIVWVAAGSPYRERGQAFGEKRIRLVAVCIGGASTNDESEELTEDLAEQVADLVDAPHNPQLFKLDPTAELDQPRLYPSANNQQNLGIAVNILATSFR